jgi:alpha-tubulin suppressor-like RCC1 family protein
MDGEVAGGSVAVVSMPTKTIFPMSSPATFTKISGGGTHTCAIGDDGTLWCWGAAGSIGATSAGTAVQIGTDTDWTAVSAGFDHVCGLRSGAQGVLCFGNNAGGQVTLPTSGVVSTPTEVMLPPGFRALVIAAGDQTTCAIASTTPSTSGLLFCWGTNDGGVPIIETATGIEHLPVTQIGSEAWTAIAIAYGMACGVRAGQVMCWGGESDGGFGDGYWAHSKYAYAPSNPTTTPADAVAVWKTNPVYQGHVELACARSGMKVSCWGSNRFGQLGQGTPSFQAAPVEVAAPTGHADWKSVVAGPSHVCATTMDDSAWCWGDDGNGSVSASIPRGNTQPCVANQPCDFATPALAPTATSTMLVAGSDNLARDFTCSLAGTTVSCWGGDNESQLGPGVNGEGPAVVAPPGTQTWARIAGGQFASCGVTKEDSPHTYCWGSVVGTTIAIPTTLPTDITNFDDVHFGNDYVCGVQSGTSTRVCWGANDSYQLGNGNTGGFTSPTSFDTTTAAIAVRGYTTCRVNTNGGVDCWGDNFLHKAGVADGFSPVKSPTPVVDATMTAIANCKSVALAVDHGCALCGGQVLCWGDAGTGRGGSTVAPYLAVPIAVSGSRTFTALAIADGAGCAIDTSHAMWCWGDSAHGVVGDGGQDRNLPTPVAP